MCLKGKVVIIKMDGLYFRCMKACYQITIQPNTQRSKTMELETLAL